MARQRREGLSDDDLGLIVRASADTPGRTYLFMLLLILTGQRVRETAMLEWDDIDLEGEIWHRKTRSKNWPRVSAMPLSSFACHLLRDARGDGSANGTRVFCPPEGEAKFLTSAKCAIRKHMAVNESTGPDSTVHALRRTFAEGCYHLGASAEILYFLLLQRDPERWRQFAPTDPKSLITHSRPILEAWSNHILKDMLR